MASTAPSMAGPATHISFQLGVGGRIVGFLGLAVAEQVHADDRVALLLQDVDPAGLAPVALERRGEAVHQQDRKFGHRGRLSRRAMASTARLALR